MDLQLLFRNFRVTKRNMYSMEYLTSNILYSFFIRIKKFTHIRLRENVVILKSSKFDLVISYMSVDSLKQRQPFFCGF